MTDEVSAEIIQSTQKLLGKHVTKPQLTEKHLRKPPFRFLHDIITALVRDSGFLKGLFTDNEMLSENVKERDAKIAFLTKLITAVKSISGKDLQARPNKIIAGLEPAETNKLLQTIGKCLSDKIDTKEYVKSLKKGTQDGKEASKVKKVASKGSVDEGAKRDKVKKNSVEITTNGKTSMRNKEKITSKTKITASSNKGSVEKLESTASTPKIDDNTPKNKEPEANNKSKKVREDKVIKNHVKEHSKPPEVAKNIPEDETHQMIDEGGKDILPQTESRIEKEESNVEEFRRPSARPKSARPRSGQHIINQDDQELIREKSEFKRKPFLTDLSKKSSLEEKMTISPLSRPRSSMLRPPSVRPSSARPGAPRLRPDSTIPPNEPIPMGKIKVIVENYKGSESAANEDEEETVVIETVPEDVVNHDNKLLEKSLDIPSDKGHLVEQILEQIQGPDGNVIDDRGRLEWENDTSIKNNDATVKEINVLRASIQALTRTANPLGKLTSYLHEDIETMQKELETWRKMRKQSMQEIEKQERINKESNQPLQLQLELLDENIKNQRDEISAVKFNIIRNDERIRQLIHKQIAIE